LFSPIGRSTAPADLAEFAIEIALSRHGKSNRVLSEKTASQMLTPVLGDAGLGFFPDKDPLGSSATTEVTKAFRRCFG
jgi:hypothetical protein